MTDTRRAIGFMSGTSMDGVDAAWVETDGVDKIRYGPVAAHRYPKEVRDALLAARGWDPAPEAEALVLDWHGPHRFELGQADLIGFHGQTVAHDPANRRTRQLGDGAALADQWGLPVVWDFRSADMAAGGQGAPLAPFFHFHAMRAAGARGRVAVLNLGGVGNVTYADLDKARAEEDGALLAFDTGPGNALIDDAVAAAGLGSFDANGAIAARGQIDEAAVARFLAHDYFSAPPPKSLDRDSFVPPGLADLAQDDAIATLTALTAASVAAGARHFPAPVAHWYVTGGGRRNDTLMTMLATRLGVPVSPIESLGLDGDMLEAQAFAWLAVRVLRGLPTSSPETTGTMSLTTGGRLSYPASTPVGVGPEKG